MFLHDDADVRVGGSIVLETQGVRKEDEEDSLSVCISTPR